MKKVAVITGYTCNNNCRFCYDSEKREHPDLSTSQIKETIKNARERSCDYIDFLGGEFTIRKDAVELIKYAKKLGYKTISITTNGRVFSYMNILKEYVDAGINSIIYSIHGHNAELHDFQTRVPGSFNQIVKAIDNTKKLGIKIFTNTTITNLNLKNLLDIANFLIKVGCVNAEFVFVDPTTGAANQNFEELVPSIKKAAPFIKKCFDVGIKNKIPHWHIRYYPLCYLDGYEKNVSEIDNPFSNEEHFGPEFENFDVVSSRKTISRMKVKKCRKCKFNSKCEGVWKKYIELKGSSEIKPVT
ncbi:MAG: radical SAM protein [Nanoarchaeota archaeon]|nr:radical SAM protein [Nanoarchaeota archaeon]